MVLVQFSLFFLFSMILSQWFSPDDFLFFHQEDALLLPFSLVDLIEHLLEEGALLEPGPAMARRQRVHRQDFKSRSDA